MLSWSRIRGVLLGIVLTLACHLIAISTVVLVSSLIYGILYIHLNLLPFNEHENFFYGFLITALAVSGVGLYQVLYILPLRRWCRHQRHYGLRQGVGIAAIVTTAVSVYGFIYVLWYWYTASLP